MTEFLWLGVMNRYFGVWLHISKIFWLSSTKNVGFLDRQNLRGWPVLFELTVRIYNYGVFLSAHLC